MTQEIQPIPMEQTVVVVNIWWKKIEWGNINKPTSEEKEVLDKAGIYQIYGHHPAYGDDSLLYIGQTNNSFTNRLGNRWEFDESTARPINVRLGQIIYTENNWVEISENELINVVEKILIKTHTPAFNQQHINGLFQAEGINDRHYLIVNWYDYGRLLPEISTLRMSYRYWMHV